MLSNHPLRGRRAPVRRRAALVAAAAALTLAAYKLVKRDEAKRRARGKDGAR